MLCGGNFSDTFPFADQNIPTLILEYERLGLTFARL